jgi:hypothetical protein
MITGTTTAVFPLTNAGTTTVTWTFDDGNGNTTTANQSITISTLSFMGFYSPIGGRWKIEASRFEKSTGQHHSGEV